MGEASGQEYGPCVAPKDIEPRRDIGHVVVPRRVPDLEPRAQECGPELGNQFLERVGVVAESFTEHTIEPMRGAAPVRQFMPKDAVIAFACRACVGPSKPFALRQFDAVDIVPAIAIIWDISLTH